MEKVLGFMILVLFIASSLGCSAFQQNTQVLTIKTSAESASIYINGNAVGTSPVSLYAKRDRSYSITARKNGYEPATLTIGHHFNETGALDVIGTFLFLVPVLGIASPGAWSLDETDVTINLFELSPQMNNVPVNNIPKT